LRNASVDIKLRRKAVLLLTDLAEYQLENIDKDEPPFFNDQDLLKSVVDLTASSDLDLQEKVIVDITFKSNVVFCSAVL
jgi:nucleotide exchange factor SIL1